MAQVRPTKIGVQSVASPMGRTDRTWIVRQRPILVVVGRPLHHRTKSSSSDSIAKVVVAKKKVYKKAAKQPN